MQTNAQAARAYQASAGFRSVREQEADVFRRANGAIRAAKEGGALARVQAVADNRRLWNMVISLLTDPENALPTPLRASIISVGRAVQREMNREAPDFDFLIAINENIAAGLSSSR